MWTPYSISIVLHHHCSPAPFERQAAPAYWPEIKRLVDMGILQRDDVDAPLRTTALGDALVRFWCETPLPVQTFVDPRAMAGAA